MFNNQPFYFTPDRELEPEEEEVYCHVCGLRTTEHYAYYIDELDIWLCGHCNDTHQVCSCCHLELTEAEECEYCASIED